MPEERYYQSGKDTLKIPPKKYVNINGKVSKDKWQSMFRYLARYVDIPKTQDFSLANNMGFTDGLHFTQLLSLLYTIRPISLLSVPVLWNIGI